MSIKSSSRFCLLSLIFLLQIGLFFSNFFYALYLKSELQGYLSKTTQLGSSISYLQSLALNTTEELVQVSNVVLPLEKATNDITFLAFYLTPFLLWLLWTLFQGTSWYLIRRNDIVNKKRFFINYSVVSAAVIGIYLAILYRLLLTELVYVESTIFLILAITLAAYMILHLFSISICGRSFFSDVKSVLKVRFIRSVFIIAVMFIASLASFFFFIALLLSAIENEYFFLSLPSIVVVVCVLSAINAVLKVYLSKS